MKPANWIPRDGLLARAVRLFRSEGHSQSFIARELRLNRRTVSRLCAGETDVESFSVPEPACAAGDVEDCLLPPGIKTESNASLVHPEALIFHGFRRTLLSRRARRYL
jgi:hypothetical protein